MGMVQNQSMVLHGRLNTEVFMVHLCGSEELNEQTTTQACQFVHFYKEKIGVKDQCRDHRLFQLIVHLCRLWRLLVVGRLGFLHQRHGVGQGRVGVPGPVLEVSSRSASFGPILSLRSMTSSWKTMGSMFLHSCIRMNQSPNQNFFMMTAMSFLLDDLERHRRPGSGST